MIKRRKAKTSEDVAEVAVERAEAAPRVVAKPSAQKENKVILKKKTSESRFTRPGTNNQKRVEHK
jgi:hypothetical protein